MICYNTTYKYNLRNQIVEDKFTVLSKKLYVQLKNNTVYLTVLYNFGIL